MKTKIIQRLLLLLILLIEVSPSWAVSKTVSWQAINRITDNADGSFTTASNAANVYALALADLSGIDGIGTVGTVNIQFYCYIPGGSRWMIGFGDKSVRGMTANSSYREQYNTEGLYMRFGENKQNNTFNVNGAETVWSPVVDQWLQINFSFNRIAHTYSYSIVKAADGTVFYSATDVWTSVSSPTIIEAYSWLDNTRVDLHNVTVTFSDFYFPHGAEIAYIEDLSYTLPLYNRTGKTASYSFSSNSYFRQDGITLYPKATTGSEPNSLWEGDPITVTAFADGEQSTTYYLRFKTRSLIDPTSLCTSNTFDAGTTPGMFSSNTVTLDGMTLSFSKDADIPVVRSINGDYGVTIIDGNGYNFGAIDNNGTLWGTVYKIETSVAKKLHVTGYFTNNYQNAMLILDGTQQGTIDNPGNGTLASGTFDLQAGKTYYLYAQQYATFALKSLSYTDAYFAQSYAITDVPADGHYQQTVTDMAGPVYSIAGIAGDLVGKGVTIDSSTGQLSGITTGGAIKIQATGGGKTVYYVLTVAYPATDYPGHIWNFYEELGGLNTSDGLKAVPVPVSTTTDSNGDVWTAIFKNATGAGRNPQWYHNNPVIGDNAFIIEETAGLVFHTGYQRFYLRNDNEEFTHLGIRDYNASFTIPRLQEGDVVEIMWRHDASGSGSQFTATNVKDLRGKAVNEEFEITESAERTITRYVGVYSFIATGGDVTFTLRDNGNCDIQYIRIYKGPYHPTMRDINLSDNTSAPNTMLLDNAEQALTYNYCNQLYSTATGPAMYVLKGYRPKVNDSQTLGVDYDHTGCVTGSNAAINPDYFTDEDAYPVSDAEKIRLYELRKNIIGLQMYNETWQSNNNSYNNGVIRATSGWGKVTIRMNNYTNDMKYVIGYTPDYTLTIGSAPHQTYPYTWDFTMIAGQKVAGRPDNVLSSIEAEGNNSDFSGLIQTNWNKNEGEKYTLNTDNDGDISSQYVPGAVLVTRDCALSYFRGVEYDDKWAKDELDGLGFSGQVTINPLPIGINNLLSYRMNNENYAVNTPLTAGNGLITFGADKREENSVAACGYGYKCDENIGSTKYAFLQLSRELKVGDVIFIKAFATSTPNGSDYGLSLYESTNSASPLATMYLTGAKNHEETLCHVVTTGDALIGKQNIYVFRATGKSTYITEIEVVDGNGRKYDGEPLYCNSEVTLTIPDLNDRVQDWIYISSSTQPSVVTNATMVTDAADGGPDANQSPEVEDVNTHVYKYKVTSSGNSLFTFAAGTYIYKIGVTHILKDIHKVGSTGWATEIRNQDIDHELIGYFTKNDVNAYTVTYDSYDLNTATVALTPINEDGYVPMKTGIVMKLDNVAGLSNANDGKNVPLFYPSYTRLASSTSMEFPTDNLMYNVDAGIDDDNRNYYETIGVGGVDYTKFILTNIHWTYDINHALNTDESAAYKEADVAGFYRMHIWKTLSDGENAAKNTMPAHNAFLLVPSGELPQAVWSQQSTSAARQNTIAIRTAWGEETGIENIELAPGLATDEENTAEDGDWYTLSGVKLPKRPTKEGLYIWRSVEGGNSGKTVFVNPRGR